MLKGLLLAVIQLFVIQLQITSQPDPRFGAFHGTVYDMPEDYLNKGYGPWVSYFDVLQHVTLDSLAVPKTGTEEKYFPGVRYKNRYAIIFSSELEIDQRGCYEFYLESDDGSRLCLPAGQPGLSLPAGGRDSLIIDNDKPHPMTAKRDSVMLGKGKYPLKVWYYTAYYPQYGLILRSSALTDTTYCMSGKSRQLVTFDANTVLFEFDSHVISPLGKRELDKICSELNKQAIRRIHVLGYTDHIGSPEYNEVLSLTRAESIVSYLKSKLIQPGIIFKAEGRGALSSGAQNADDQHLNRRVEIYVE